jgi:SAM-dependent methyltransferase
MSPDVTILRCPVTGSPLTSAPGSSLMSSEGRSYRVVHGAPVLIDSEHSVFDVDVAGSADGVHSGHGSVRRLLDRFVPSPTRSVGSRERFERLAQLIADRGWQARVLVVGGGVLGEGMADFVEHTDFELVETDIYIGPRTQIVCDAHQLPFADGCFDAVVAQAVLEHVMDPQRVVAEIHRVLKPGGLVYAETPFMQQVHDGAYDITRFTMVGHRRLFRWFDELDAGVVCGPATTLIWALRYFMRSLPRRSRLARELLDRAMCIAFSWIKYLDDYLVDRPGSVDAASGIYFLGRRRDSPVSDREVIASYRGAFRSLPRRSIGSNAHGR